MWDAIHKKTGDRLEAGLVWIEYEDPHKEEWYCCELHKQQVTPVIKHIRKQNGEEIIVLSHFRMIGEGHFCPGESDLHWNLKVELAKKIQEKEIKLPYNGYSFTNEKLENRLERTKGNRRADVLFEFDKYNSLYGKGIVIEIVVSEPRDSLIKKTIDWIKNKYSVTWIHPYTFPEGKIDIKYPFGLYRDTVKWCGQLNWNWKKYHERQGENIW